MKSVCNPQLDPTEHVAVDALSVFELEVLRSKTGQESRVCGGARELQSTRGPVPVSGPRLRH